MFYPVVYNNQSINITLIYFTLLCYLDSLAEVGAGILGIGTKLLLNSQQLVVLSKTLRSARSSRFYLACTKSHDKVSNKAVLCLTRPVGHHGAPPFSFSHIVSLNRLSHRTNLIYFQQKSIAGFLFNSSLDSLRICNKQVISNYLNISFLCEFGISSPVILVKRILNGHNREVLDKALVHLQQRVGADPVGLLGVWVLEVKIIFSILEELTGSNIHTNHDFSLIARLLLDQSLKMMVQLRAHPHGLRKACSTSWKYHELLHGQLVTSMGPSIDHIETRNRH